MKYNLLSNKQRIFVFKIMNLKIKIVTLYKK